MAKETATKRRYRAVIDEYFANGFNRGDAYKKVYKKVKDTKTACANFRRIEKDPYCQKYIAQKHEEAKKIVQINNEGLLKELKQWLEADITITLNKSPEEIQLLPPEIRRLITKVKHTKKTYYDKSGTPVEEEQIELHFASKEKAIDMIAKHIGFYEKDNTQKANDINIFASNGDHMKIINDILQSK